MGCGVMVMALAACGGGGRNDAPPGGAPQTLTPQTVAPQAAAPHTVAPQTAAQLTGAPQAGAPQATAAPVTAVPVPVTYLGVETRLLDGDLVGFEVRLRGADTAEAVGAYARCAAAQYTLIRGYGFARHVRTNLRNEGGIWLGDAVYTISPALPRGLQTIDAEVTVSDCAERGIPTV